LQERIICAGFGGQGIMLLGKLLATAALIEDKFTTWMPSYGAEVRGGTAHSMVIISDEPIASPVIGEPTSCIIMNKPSFDKFIKRISKKGLFIVNTTLVKELTKTKGVNLVKIPLTQIAVDLGNPRVANMIAAGAYISKTKILSKKSLKRALKEILPMAKKNLLELNEKAIDKGASLI